MITLLIRTTIIYIFITMAMRVTGKRQIGELEVSELVVTFMLSELAAIPITDSSLPLLNVIAPILLLLSYEGIISYLTMKIPIFKKLFYGKPNILIYEGKLNQKELRRERLELSELLCTIRQSGISSIADVHYAILEENGKISVFPKTSSAPVTPKQLDLEPKEDGVSLPIIMDRRIIKENLLLRGWSRERLEHEIAKRGLQLSDVFLLSVDDANNVYIIRRENKR